MSGNFLFGHWVEYLMMRFLFNVGKDYQAETTIYVIHATRADYAIILWRQFDLLFIPIILI